MPIPSDPIRLFSDYVAVTGIGRLEQAGAGDPALAGKRLGLIHGACWITLWCNYFGRRYLPGVKLVHAGNDAVQLNFTQAHADGRPSDVLIRVRRRRTSRPLSAWPATWCAWGAWTPS